MDVRSVLGKRRRIDTPTSLKRAKRQWGPNDENDENDENQTPECIEIDAQSTPDGCLQADELTECSPFSSVQPERAKLNAGLVSSPKKQYDRSDEVRIYTEPTPSHTPTPQTPRHRDALSKTVTPRHRVLAAGTPLTPKTPRTPRTPSTAVKTVYQDARRAFTRSADPGRLIGRDVERGELEEFIVGNARAGRGGCLYVSGPPGTGKSALVGHVCRDLKEREGVGYANVNCMSIKAAPDLFSLTASELGIWHDASGHSSQKMLQQAFTSRVAKKVHLVVLDEIDQLLSLDAGVLCSMFEWALSPNSKLLLIGIANALDLTDRFLPRLKARNLKPLLLPFLPYTAQETGAVLTSRCRSLLPTNTTAAADFTPFLHPTAVQLISKKVASQNGDLRRAFDIAQRAIDLVEAETKDKFSKQILAENSPPSTPTPTPTPTRTPLGENINFSSPSQPSPPSKSKPASPPTAITALLANLTPETAPRATLAHVVRVTSAAFNNGPLERLKSLNLQQKAILCALVSLDAAAGRANAKPAAPTLRGLYERYTSRCRAEGALAALSSSEFRDAVAGLETLGLVGAADGRGGSVAAAATTPSRKGRGAFAGGKAEERALSCVVGVEDVRAAVGGGAGREILSGFLRGY